jgi:DNA-binding LacI/PurR family transcriptional regulator
MNGGLEEAVRDPVSQRDIARHFGVSHVTVSLALRHSRRVSKSLAEEIRAHAEKVGYHRDPVLLALSAYRDRKLVGPVRGAIGWINAWENSGRLREHPEIERFWRGAQAAASEKRLRLEEFRLGTELSPGRLHEILDTRNIRGLIVPPHLSPDAWSGFPWDEYAVVSFGHGLHGPRGHRVLPATAANLLLAIRKMREKGCRRIGGVTAMSLLRRAGYCMVESLPAVLRALPGGGELELLDLDAFPKAGGRRGSGLGSGRTSWRRSWPTPPRPRT